MGWLSTLAVLLLLVGGLFYSSGRSTDVVGVAEGIHGKGSRVRPKRYIAARLDTGKVVYVYLPEQVAFEKDQRVLISKKKTALFGAEKYEFKKYLDDTGASNCKAPSFRAIDK